MGGVMRSNINPETRGYRYASSGDDTWDGRSLELPKKAIQVALDSAAALIPTPTPFNSARVKEAQGGIYFEDLTLYESVLYEGSQTTIVSSGLVGVMAASFVSFDPQTIANSTDNATALLIQDVEQFGTDMSAVIIGGDNAIGIHLDGELDAIFVSVNQFRIGGTGTTGVKVTSTSPTPPDVNFHTASFDGNNETFFEYDPVNSTDLLDLEISTLADTSDAGGGGYSGTTGLAVKGGVLKVRAGSLVASEIARVYDGGTLGMSAIALGGNTIVESGGSCIYPSVGVMAGNMETIGTGTLQTSIETIIGDTLNKGGMSIKSDQVVGDIHNDGTLFAIIDDHDGSLTGSGVTNGVIGGVKQGNWRDKIALNAASLITQGPVSTGTTHQVTFGPLLVGDGIDIDALGNMTVTIADQFTPIFTFQPSRTTNGGVVHMYFRVLVDSTPIYGPDFLKMNGTNDDAPLVLTVPPQNLSIGQVMTVELIRSIGGVNEGDLYANNPSAGGWASSPSARAVIIRG